MASFALSSAFVGILIRKILILIKLSLDFFGRKVYVATTALLVTLATTSLRSPSRSPKSSVILWSKLISLFGVLGGAFVAGLRKVAEGWRLIRPGPVSTSLKGAAGSRASCNMLYSVFSIATSIYLANVYSPFCEPAHVSNTRSPPRNLASRTCGFQMPIVTAIHHGTNRGFNSWRKVETIVALAMRVGYQIQFPSFSADQFCWREEAIGFQEIHNIPCRVAYT